MITRFRKLAAAAATIGTLLAGSSLIAAAPASAATVSSAHYYVPDSTAGQRMLDAAETRLNDPYTWGGTGPSSFDCSGLVYWAARAAGERNWPRDTYDIAAQIGSRFTITTHPRRGDLALWGSYRAPYHVEFVTIWASTFGAETYGWAGRVTWHSTTWYRPSFYLHINW